MVKSASNPLSSAPLLVVAGEELFLRTEHLAEIKRAVLGEGDPGLAMVRFDETARVATVLDEARTPSMFAPRKLVIVDLADTLLKGGLEEGATPPGRGERPAPINRELLESYLESPPDFSVLVLVCESWLKTTRLHKALDKRGAVLWALPLKDGQIVPWLRERARVSYGKSIDAPAAERLKDLIGPDLQRLDNELAKLALYAPGNPAITLDAINALVGFQHDRQIWDMIDALSGRDAAAALKKIDEIWQLDPKIDYKAIGAITAWLNQVLKARELLDARQPDGLIIRNLKLWPPDRARKVLSLARGWGLVGAALVPGAAGGGLGEQDQSRRAAAQFGEVHRRALRGLTAADCDWLHISAGPGRDFPASTDGDLHEQAFPDTSDRARGGHIRGPDVPGGLRHVEPGARARNLRTGDSAGHAADAGAADRGGCAAAGGPHERRARPAGQDCRTHGQRSRGRGQAGDGHAGAGSGRVRGGGREYPHVAAGTGTVSAVTPPASAGTALALANPPAPAGSGAATPTAISAMASMTALGAGPTTVTPAGAAGVNGAAADRAMGSLLEVLRERVAAHPNQINYALALELLETAETGKAADPASLGALSAVDQRLLADLVPAVQSLAARPATPTTTLADRAAPLTAAAEKWEADADLALPRLALASRVDSYGVYSPVEPKFEYGKRNVVIIYCEVAHFTSKAIDNTTAAGHETVYETRLAQQDTLITDNGLLVWRPNPEEVEDRSRNQRHDFYLVKKLTIPENLAIGKYTLRMSVTDKLSDKIAMATIPIEVVGPAGSGPISSTAGK